MTFQENQSVVANGFGPKAMIGVDIIGQNQMTHEQIGVPSISLLNGEGHVRPLVQIEAEIITFAIDHYRGRRGHMSEVARRLCISRSTLYRKARP